MALSLLVLTILAFGIVKGDGDCPKLQRFPFQRPEPKNHRVRPTYNPKRTPSYCDRIVTGCTHRGSQSEQDKSFKVHEYQAITNEYIDQSDHDLIYAHFTFDMMSILSVSFNLGDFRKSIAPGVPEKEQTKAWSSIVCSIQTALKSKWKDIDIFFFGFQEADYYFSYEPLKKAFRESFTKDAHSHDSLHWDYVLREHGSNFAAKNTIALIYYNKNSVFYTPVQPSSSLLTFEQTHDHHSRRPVKRAVEVVTAKVKQSILLTKTAELIGKFARSDVSDSPNLHIRYLTFANAHLPICFNAHGCDGLGVSQRDHAMDKIRNTFETDFVDDADEKECIVLVGDLNYRIMEPNTENEYEQLNKYLEQQETPFWQEIEPVWNKDKSKRRFLPTCKRIEGSWETSRKTIEHMSSRFIDTNPMTIDEDNHVAMMSWVIGVLMVGFAMFICVSFIMGVVCGYWFHNIMEDRPCDE
eukprot:33227_1